MLDLQNRPGVEQAWLNHTGELLAVVWRPASRADERQSTLAAVSEAYAVSMDELNGVAQETALKDFRSGLGWYRGADVDRLSAQEASVISARLLQRVATQERRVTARGAAVAPVLTEAVRRQL